MDGINTTTKLSSTPNSSHYLVSMYGEPPIVFWMFLSVETLLIISGNLMLCWLFLTNRKLRTQQNYFVLSLSVSDLLVGLSVAPCEFCALKNPMYKGQDCPLFCGSVMSFNMLASTINLVLIATDRYCSITMPFRYQTILSKRRAVIIIVIGWLITFLMTLLPLSWILNNGMSVSRKQNANIIFSLTSFALVFLVGFALGVIYYTIVSTVREKLRSSKERSSNPAGIKVCIIVAISFFICWIPNCSVELLLQRDVTVSQRVINTAYFIMLVNPCLDPILYAYYRHDFRRELASWKRCQWSKIKNAKNGITKAVFGRKERVLDNTNNNHQVKKDLKTLQRHNTEYMFTSVATEEETVKECVTDRVSVV